MKKLLIISSLLLSIISFGQQKQSTKEPEFVKYMNSPWVDSIMKKMSLKDKVAQMIFIELRPASPETIIKAGDLVKNLNVGGGVIFASNLTEQARIINKLQSDSKIPLLIAIDGEWGLGMRLSDVENFPFQSTLGSLKSNELLYKMGEEVARQAKRAGIHINLAPTVDVNNNAANPVIGYRSFGSDPKDVAEKGLAYMKGMEAGGILCTAKHFPGHGDTSVDSHLDLPKIEHSMEHLNQVELVPFKHILSQGGTGLMPGHLNVPALTGENVPSSLSPKAVRDYVRKELGYKGIIFTDGMDMRGISSYYSPGEAAIRAVIAGNDILELVRDPYVAVDSIVLAVKQKRIPESQINESVRRILAAKYYVGLNKYKPTNTYNIVKDVNNPQNKQLIAEMTQKSITALENKNDILPLKIEQGKKTAVLSLRTKPDKTFTNRLKSYFPVDYYTLDYKKTLAKPAALVDSLKKYDILIIELGDLNRTPGNPKNKEGDKNPQYQFGVSEYVRQIVEKTTNQQKVIFTMFGSPYALDAIPSIKNSQAVVYVAVDTPVSRDLMAQALAGAFDTEGKLPVILQTYPMGTSVNLKGAIRFKFTAPEEVGIDSEELNSKIDSIINNAILSGAFPGGQIIIAKDQKVFYQNAFGFHDQTGKEPVLDSDIYDMASVTKITGALPVYMMLFEKGQLNLDAPISEYLPKLKYEKSNKKDVSLRSQLSHIAGFEPFYPFFKDAKEKGLVSNEQDKKHTIKIDDNMWISPKTYDFVYKEIKELPLTAPDEYKYSCLGFVLAPRIIETITGENFIDYVENNFYTPLGADRTSFQPLNKGFSKSEIAPTEVDTLFRSGLIHGYTHDEASALLGGYSSNAGLFSNAMGIAKIMQMYLNKGTYGGVTFFSPETFDVFNTAYYKDKNNRRVLGFDKPLADNKTIEDNKIWPARSASEKSFGHSGFTGTFTWADPSNGLVYVFISNRVFPTRNNPEFNHRKTSIAVQQLVYDLIEKGAAKYKESEGVAQEKAPALFAD